MVQTISFGISPNRCIKINNILENESTEDKLVYLSEIFYKTDMKIKIYKNVYDNIIEIYKKLQNHEYFNIIPITGFIQCKDDFINIKQDLIKNGICNGSDNNQIYLLITKNITNIIEPTKIQQKISIFLQLSFTMMELYYNYGIIYDKINFDHISICSTNIETTFYNIQNPFYNYMIKTHGVRVYINDFDTAEIENRSSHTYKFIESYLIMCKYILNKYELIDHETYKKVKTTLIDDINIIKQTKLMKVGAIADVYSALKYIIIPKLGEDVLYEIR
jgi:hypothetical protein